MDEEYIAFTEIAPGPEVTRIEKHKDFVKLPFLGFSNSTDYQPKHSKEA